MRKLGSTAGLFVLRSQVVFPLSLTPISVDRDENISIVQEAMKTDRLVAMFPVYNYTGEGVSVELPEIPVFKADGEVLSKVGVLARIVRELQLPDGSIKIVVRGIKRIEYEALKKGADGSLQVQYHSLEEDVKGNSEARD